MAAAAVALALVGVAKTTNEFNFASKTFHSAAFVLPSHRFCVVKSGFSGCLDGVSGAAFFMALKYFIIFRKVGFLFRCVVSALKRAKNDGIYNDDRKSACAVFNLNRKLSVLYIHCKSNEY